MVDMANDFLTIGTEHWRSNEWKEKGRVAGAKLKPDLVWLWKDAGDMWRKVVVDVKVTSTEDLNKAFQEKTRNMANGQQARQKRRRWRRQ